MADAAQVLVSPADLKFRFQLNKQLLATITVNNPLDRRVAFKIKTTMPKKYVVRPSSGIVEAKSSTNVQVIMQAQKEVPPDFATTPCRDKFMIQVTPLADGEAIDKETFDRDKRKVEVQEHRLRVLLEGPAAPPSPVPEADVEEDSSVKAAATAAPVESAHPVSRMGANSTASPSGQEVTILRQRLDQSNRELQALRAQLVGQQAAGSKGAARGGASGVGMLYLVLVAIIAFLLGHFQEAIRAWLRVLSS